MGIKERIKLGQMPTILFTFRKHYILCGWIFIQVGMVNSSFIYSVDEESADLATPYLTSEGEPREVAWQAFSDVGEDVGPAGQKGGGVVLRFHPVRVLNLVICKPLSSEI